MSVTISKRKKYVRPMTATWWQKLDFYKAYMVREATSIFAVWFCIVLLYGVLCLASNPVPGLGIVDFIGFLRNPIVVFLNIITLIATLYHTATYFVMTPKVMNIIVKNERLPHHVLRNALWAVTAVISVIALILVYNVGREKMVDQNPKRSGEPPVWLMFGAGGTVSAIFFPVVILILGLLLPFGLIDPHNLITFAYSWIGKLVILVLTIFPMWCGLHRIHHAMHDLKIHVLQADLSFTA